MKTNEPIGIFDSGLGGISVLRTLVKELPSEDVIYVGDSLHNPYGTKTKEEILERCIAICDFFMEHHVKLILIACNTATSACVNILRQRYPVDIVGMEPALKVACSLGRKQHIAVWATDLTLKEKKFASLMEQFQDEHRIDRVPCPKLVSLVEQDHLQDKTRVDDCLKEYLSQSCVDSLNSIVLGCTHFVFFKEHLEALCPSHCKIVDGNQGTVLHAKDLLEQKNLLQSNRQGTIAWFNTDEGKIEQSKRLFNYKEEK